MTQQKPAPPPPSARPAQTDGNGASGEPPKLAEGVELVGLYQGSGFKDPPYLVRRSDGQMVQLTDLLFYVAEGADGRRGHADIAAFVTPKFGKQVSADNVAVLVDKLRERGVMAGPDDHSPQLQKPDPLLALKFRKTILPAGPTNFIAAALRPLFWPPVMLAVGGALVALDIWYFAVHGIAQSLRVTLYQPIVILAIYGMLIVSVFWHELGHATACRYGGAKPGHIGFGIYIVWPAFYNDVTDIYRLGKASRVRTDLGGVYFNAIFGLACGGLYFLTHFEPLLLVLLMQHLLIFYQFLPFLRLDGYYVVSDLTGIPDLFPRIRPTLRSLRPGKKTPPEVAELKPWARMVVTGWVLLVIPVLLYAFTMMVIAAPRTVATGWDSFWSLWDKASSALGTDKWASAAVNAIQMGFLVLPMGGMSYTLGRVGHRIGAGLARLTSGRPIARTFVVLVGAATIGLAGFVLWPNGDYKPIQPDERWTISESFDAVAAVTTGRPGLTEERERELGGAPGLEEQGATPTGESEGGKQDSSDEQPIENEQPIEEEEESSDEETETEATPTPEPSESPAPSPTG